MTRFLLIALLAGFFMAAAAHANGRVSGLHHITTVPPATSATPRVSPPAMSTTPRAPLPPAMSTAPHAPTPPPAMSTTPRAPTKATPTTSARKRDTAAAVPYNKLPHIYAPLPYAEPI
ncbi:hypothetical protein GGH95_004504 [Coemansia sp. RSA 1836]|nr:hypothetical protein GGH95_004504 [Coemansia sp. RSA 1836]